MGWRCPRPSTVAKIPRNTSTGRRSRHFRRAGRSVLVYQHYPRKPHENRPLPANSAPSCCANDCVDPSIHTRTMHGLTATQVDDRLCVNRHHAAGPRWSEQISICDVWTESLKRTRLPCGARPRAGHPLSVSWTAGDARPGLDSCLRALRTGDVLVVWTLDRLGRTLAHLVNTVQTSTASTNSSKVFVRRGRGTSNPAVLALVVFLACEN